MQAAGEGDSDVGGRFRRNRFLSQASYSHFKSFWSGPGPQQQQPAFSAQSYWQLEPLIGGWVSPACYASLVPSTLQTN